MTNQKLRQRIPVIPRVPTTQPLPVGWRPTAPPIDVGQIEHPVVRDHVASTAVARPIRFAADEAASVWVLRTKPAPLPEPRSDEARFISALVEGLNRIWSSP